jgi:hypothetical protein
VTVPTTVIVTTAPASPTVTQIVPPRTDTVVQTETQIQTQTATVAAPPPATTTVAATTTSGVSPAGAAAAGAAAAANKNEETSSTQWGWIAFGVLAAAVLVGGFVWLLRRRHSTPTDGGSAPPLSP